MVAINELRATAGRVAAAADLMDVRLFHVDSTLTNVPVGSEGLTYSFDSTVEVQESDGESAILIVDGSYDVDLHQADADESGTQESADGGRPIAQLSIQLAAMYAVRDAEEADFTDDELDAFAKTTGLLALHPYARELVSSLTSRMGLPALHIGTVRIPLDKRDADS